MGLVMSFHISTAVLLISI